MLPGRRLLQWIAVWFVGTTLALFTPWGAVCGLIGLLGGLGVCAYQALRRTWQHAPILTRHGPEAFARGQWGTLTLRLESQAPCAQHLEVFDDLPNQAEFEGMPLSLTLQPGEVRQVTYRVRFLQRGDAELGAFHVRFHSPGRWLEAVRRLGPSQRLRVFPDYAPVVRYALMALQGRPSATGVRRRRLRGVGAEFHQLREYREGDAITTVDWKATARRSHLIVRDYQEERNQRITFLVDCGQRMRAFDGGVPLLDHSLNALLLVAYVALRQGDRVAIAAYGGVRRWMPPVQGPKGMPAVLRAVYDYQATRAVSDMESGAREVLRREPRRSLVVLLTQLRPEDKDDVLRAHRVLSRRHLVLIASLRETSVQEWLDRPVENEADAWRFGAASLYVQQRAEFLAELRARGMLALDLLPKDLPVALASEYLDLKASGRL
ncbi:MAG TPA: DUF58 domain-containing protein [Planctomycetota bacterium]|nr:DUF58 domain-containing protein [Planctomycetota bacterium]HRV80752.1 DUF58 domain-containing protein [Planctomycetota bacterium]